jgi:ABC-type lipoprotein release transport system permease subunit
LEQNPPRTANVLIRLRGGDTSRGTAVQRELADIDPGVVVGDVETARHFVDRYFASPQFRAALLAAFAIVALLLALVGLYSVLSHLVTQRVREIGIRMALGATRADVLALVVTEGMGLTVLGVAAGVVSALWLSTFLASVLFGVTPHDPLTLGVVAVALGVTSFIAVVIPAVRAAGTDPVVAIRQE